MRNYIITTKRLGLRNWLPSDEAPFIAMCKDEQVMEHFPAILSEAETKVLIKNLTTHFKTYGYTYFAVDVLNTKEFIGFTGLKNQTWKSNFTPCVDIGYRLKRSAWGKGFATEAAKACLNAGFKKFDLEQILSFTTNTNTVSENVMKKIGMQFIGTVQHPHIADDPRFDHCVVYSKKQ